MNRRKIQIVLIAMLLNLTSFFGAVIVSAYLVSEDEAMNEFTPGNNKTEIIENYEEVQNLRPGMTVDKAVSVKNTGLNDCYVRVLALFSDSRAEEYASININETDWEKRADGYYYYGGTLSSGESTENLFTEVNISQDAETENLKGFEIIIYAESINAEMGGFS
ncbi:MAG: hypothetical protein MJ161_03010 [Clostridia bacterium]|nr:hypothetical protein [Clostridia bacterium]